MNNQAFSEELLESVIEGKIDINDKLATAMALYLLKESHYKFCASDHVAVRCPSLDTWLEINDNDI